MVFILLLLLVLFLQRPLFCILKMKTFCTMSGSDSWGGHGSLGGQAGEGVSLSQPCRAQHPAGLPSLPCWELRYSHPMLLSGLRIWFCFMVAVGREKLPQVPAALGILRSEDQLLS